MLICFGSTPSFANFSRNAGSLSASCVTSKLNRQRGDPSDDRTLGRAGVVEPAKIGDVLGNDVLGPPDPRRAAGDLGSSAVPLVMRERCGSFRRTTAGRSVGDWPAT